MPATVDKGNLAEDLHLLEVKLNQLRLDYERYFMGDRPREPAIDRQAIQKEVLYYSNNPIQNTALRFKFNSINSRYQAFKRQWDSVLRQIEAGTYKRHLFRANLREKASAREESPSPGRAPGGGRAVASQGAGAKLLDAYKTAAASCGQRVGGLSAEKLQSVVDKQTRALKGKLGCRDVAFRVVVQDGKVKLKATPIRE